MRFVTPSVERIELNGGSEWIEVKRELTVGEEKKFRSAGFKQMTNTGGDTPSVEVDWARLAIARVEAFLVDWSATRTDKSGKRVPVPVNRANIEALSQEDFEAIDEAIQAHMERVAAEKKVKSTPAPESFSPPSSS